MIGNANGGAAWGNGKRNLSLSQRIDGHRVMITDALVLDETICPRLFQSTLLMFLSKISYSLYLVHMVFVRSTSDMLNGFTWYGGLAPAGRFGIYFPVFCALSILAALLLHYTVEKPFLILKDRVGCTPDRLRRNRDEGSE